MMDLHCPDCHRTRCRCTDAEIRGLDFDPVFEPLPDPLLPYRRLLDEEAFEARMQGISPDEYRRGLEEMTP